jgi:hypothetical protein
MVCRSRLLELTTYIVFSGTTCRSPNTPVVLKTASNKSSGSTYGQSTSRNNASRDRFLKLYMNISTMMVQHLDKKKNQRYSAYVPLPFYIVQECDKQQTCRRDWSARRSSHANMMYTEKGENRAPAVDEEHLGGMSCFWRQEWINPLKSGDVRRFVRDGGCYTTCPRTHGDILRCIEAGLSDTMHASWNESVMSLQWNKAKTTVVQTATFFIQLW